MQCKFLLIKIINKKTPSIPIIHQRIYQLCFFIMFNSIYLYVSQQSRDILDNMCFKIKFGSECIAKI